MIQHGPNRIRITSEATLDIVEQAAYYREKADDKLARRWRSAVNDAALSLVSFPHKGSLCHPELKRVHGLRRLSIDGFPKHHLFYKYFADEKVILVITVQHDARDPDLLLRLDH